MFPNTHSPCEQCGLRNIPCNAQQPVGQGNALSESVLPLGDEGLIYRVAEVETDVRDIRASKKAIGGRVGT